MLKREGRLEFDPALLLPDGGNQLSPAGLIEAAEFGFDFTNPAFGAANVLLNVGNLVFGPF
jgi:hypothetical protein